MDFETEINRILSNGGTKADKARDLYNLGCDRSDVVVLLNMAYSQANSIWRKLSSGGRARTEGQDDSTVDSPSYPQDGNGSELEDSREGSDAGSRLHLPSRPLSLSPSQVRYITQDGHRIVRVDTNHGPECIHCREPLTFSLRYLGFIHSFSKNEPTDIEDHPEAIR